MFAGPPSSLDLADRGEAVETLLEQIPDRPAVFLIETRGGSPYLGRTLLLRRRLRRLLRPETGAGRSLSLRAVAQRVHYWLVGSNLEAGLLLYELASLHFPEDYRARIKLRPPPLLKIILTNPFPRSQITTRLSAAPALYYGPFPTRAAAENFRSRFLDLFQMRRCEEDLVPSPSHPGCIYGEMNLCLRPCQQVVSREEYRTEIERVLDFLRSQGRSLLEVLVAARERLSQECQFEEAARIHRRIQKIEEVLRLRGELAADIERLHGVAVTPAAEPGFVLLWFVIAGCWQAPRRLDCRPEAASGQSLDKRLRELVAGLAPNRPALKRREEHLALLARWFYSSARQGEWVAFESLEAAPYRRLVRAISRLAAPRDAAGVTSSGASQ
jgi:excinuclease ABC subunit C